MIMLIHNLQLNSLSFDLLTNSVMSVSVLVAETSINTRKNHHLANSVFVFMNFIFKNALSYTYLLANTEVISIPKYLSFSEQEA